MLDSEIVAAIVAGDADGLAAAYDRYAAPLYAFCCSLLPGPAGAADAADAVQNTFIVAHARLDGLTDPDLLRSWLYAVARNECHRRLRARAATAGPAAAAAASGETIDLRVNLERAAPGEVVGAAIAALTLAQRELVELSLRQDFDSDDLASTLGVSVNHAQVLASRAREEFEKSLGVLLVARSGRLSCRKLDEMLEDWDGQLTGPSGKRLGRHIRRCRICSARRNRELEPAVLLGVLPVTAIARGLRPQVLGVVASAAPDAVGYREDVVLRAGPFQASGFPAAAEQPRAQRSVRRPSGPALAAAAVFAGLCALALVFSVHHDHGQQQLAAAAPAGRQPLASPQPPAATSGQVRAKRSSSPAGPASPLVATPSATPTVSVTLPVVPPSSPAARPGPSGRPPGTSRPTPTPPPTSAPGTLSVSPTSVTLGVSAGGGASSGSFTLTASGGAVSYAISIPSAYAGELTVSPSSGSLAAGASVTVSVTWDSSAVLQTGLTVDPVGQTVAVSYQPPTGTPSAPPVAGPRSGL